MERAEEAGVESKRKKVAAFINASIYPVYFFLAGALVIELPQPWNGYAAGVAVAGLYPLWMWALWKRRNLPKPMAETEEPRGPK